MTDYFHWRGVEDARGWVVFLPGSSGLTVFDDDHHYFDAAKRLNESGWSVLLVDYKPAYHAAANRPDVNTGEKIVWITEAAIAWMNLQQPTTMELPGAIVAWSLGAEGALRMTGNRAENAGIDAIALYYPSNRENVRPATSPPLLILTGEIDDVTTLESVKRFATDETGNTLPHIELHTYANAHHGFDIASLKEEKSLRILPWIGPKATLQYDAAAAEDAEKQLLAFLERAASKP